MADLRRVSCAVAGCRARRGHHCPQQRLCLVHILVERVLLLRAYSRPSSVSQSLQATSEIEDNPGDERGLFCSLYEKGFEAGC